MSASVSSLPNEYKNNVIDFNNGRVLYITARNNGLAHNKQAIQSSNYSSGYVANKAVDGEVSSYSSTLKENNNYWSVDLGMDVNIHHLYITNYYGSPAGKLTHFPLVAQICVSELNYRYLTITTHELGHH